MIKQGYRCAGCGMRVDPGIIHHDQIKMLQNALLYNIYDSNSFVLLNERSSKVAIDILFNNYVCLFTSRTAVRFL